MTDPRSEQDGDLELDAEPPYEDPRAWRDHDPDLAENADPDPAEQLTVPGGGGEPGDTEPTAIAEEYDPAYPGGPEQDAVRVDEE
ncbi:hypothetical protein [Actinophytocola gossypii]|uniref:DUF5709 domain-containing protein n=1 Tax=Actinophytocola gossypii TaxID=2812003 RepID=A0ABT2J3F0_9PSEU|nr:hypothetical protein [Actinophytocola gossypii]MCT2582382.1 hypothetical protein [Actinophytocola gossypii]